ncbi:hypothetical protein HQN87_21975 [Paenibacillus tritici]|uniref:SLH domain-containing protein n=2 Tax=Paenibacillus tritici TaxID=1873425 RepID=A0ABX2DTI5_9BACL|nr:hypothetical protein [Paenibacillus tritici]NQX47998.1 hypothetical protein [Paenibacillus tritici]QUL58156.1 hypothetical protein KDC22_11795 [Paenibacillus tritici]
MTDQAFAPAGQVTRAQFAALLVRGLGLSTESVTNAFNLDNWEFLRNKSTRRI